MPEGTITTLLKPENKQLLAGVLTYHVVAGRVDSKTLVDLIKKNGGTYSAATVNGGKLTFTQKRKDVLISVEKGGLSKVTIKDVYQSNGVIHVVDTVVMPKG